GEAKRVFELEFQELEIVRLVVDVEHEGNASHHRLVTVRAHPKPRNLAPRDTGPAELSRPFIAACAVVAGSIPHSGDIEPPRFLSSSLPEPESFRGGAWSG